MGQLILSGLAPLLLMLASAGLAEKPRTQGALGLSPLDQGISLWLVRPKTMVGVELGVLELEQGHLGYYSGYSGSYVYDQLRHDYEKLLFRVGLSLKRIIAERTVSPFWYLATWVNYRKEKVNLENRNTTWGHTFFAAGWGGLWRPVEKVSISLRQGVAFRGSGQTVYIRPLPEDSFDTETSAIYMLQTRLLVLIHF